MKKFLITTAIPYVNAAPHIGFSLEIVQADTIARYHRLLGEDVYFLTGTDENALKNVKAAEEEDLAPQALVDKYSARYRALKKALNLSFDGFIRTTEKRHFLGSQKFWQACQKDIYKKTYQGWYCLGCEEFKTKKELTNNCCPEHPNQKLEFVEEENYFFALSKYQKEIESLIEKERLKIIPQERKNEMLSFVRSGLKDFSISRSKKRAKNWGIPVPGDPSQVIYVWFDALINYLTGLGYTENGKLYQKYWLNNKNILHCIGKGIIRFHAIYWPAMLMSAGLPLPRQEFIHGYITVEGQKISKSLGNIIDPFELVKKYKTDAVRYYLLREIPSYGDGNFSANRFREVYNADLANGLGNAVSRVAKLCAKINFTTGKYKELDNLQLSFDNKVKEFVEAYRFDKALERIWTDTESGVHAIDQTFDKTQPWGLKGKQLEKNLIGVVSIIKRIAYNLQPFLPETSEKILSQFSGQVLFEKPLFPRLY